MTDLNSAPANVCPESLDRGLVSDLMSGLKKSFVKEDPTLLTPYVHTARSLTLWHNPLHSGIALGSILVSILIARYLAQDLPSLLLGTVFYATLLNLVYKLAGKLVQLATGTETLPDAHRSFAPHARLALTDDQARHVASVLVTSVNGTMRGVTSIVLVEDLGKTLMALAGIYVAWTLASWMATTTILLVATVLVFALPIAYDQNREVVDAQRAIVMQLVNDKLGVALEKSRSLRQDITSKLNATVTSATTTTEAAPKPKEE
ncbi:Reticulon-domain-containing protein [Catenaria anguillulae PL171]|uniref:Reticulon-like protein n=1 Tax=Catenaria anguillulae PL171 TaxID=765915 RepID=A0A1Y2HY55_9FUNG|nr:Reticulon-domain-containing protein [Catenaria anguillulae PL171]